MDKMIDIPSVGEILVEEFMQPKWLSAYKLAKDILVPVSRIQDIIKGRRKVTVDTSIRLGVYFGISERYFYNIQNDIDFRKQKAEMKDDLKRITSLESQSA